MGFDNDCIVNIQSLTGEYFCPVCRTLVYPNEAIQSKCTHLYCKPCLAYVVSTVRACPYDGSLVTEADSKPLIESNKALAETIGKISVQCLYHRSGCHWQGPLSDCPTHSSACPFGNCVVACSRCTVHVVHREVQEHLQTCTGLNPKAQQETESNKTQTATQSAAPASQAQPQAGAAAPSTQAQSTKAAAQPNQEQHQIQQQHYQLYQQLQLHMQQQLLQAQHLHQFKPHQQMLTQAQLRPLAPAQLLHQQPQPYPHNQTQMNPRPPFRPQYRPPVRNVQIQVQQPPPQAVPGHTSYPQFQPRQQMLQPLPLPPPPPPPPPPQPQLPLHIPGQIRGQFPSPPPPPPPPQMPSPQSHTLLLNQQPQAFLPNFAPAQQQQQQQIHQHQQIQQQGPAVGQPPVMQNIQQSVTQQYTVLQPFPGQSGPFQIQLHQHTPFAPQQPMHSQPRSQGPQPQMMPQNYPAHLQPQQGAAVAHALHANPFQPFSQLPGQLGGASQVGPMQLGLNQTSGPSTTMVERKGDVLSEVTVAKQETGAPSEYTAEKLENSAGENSLKIRTLISKYGSEPGGPLVKDKGSEVNAVEDESCEPVVKITVKEEGNVGALDSLPSTKSTESLALEEGKRVMDPLNDSSLQGKDSTDAMDVNTQSSHQNVIPPENIRSSLVSSDRRQHNYQGTPQEQYGQGDVPLQGDEPAESSDPQSGTMRQTPPDGHEGQLGQQGQLHPVNPVETDMVHNLRPNFDSRDPNSNVLGYSERGSFGQPSGKSVELRIDGAPDLSSTIKLKDQTPFLIEQTQGLDKEAIEEGCGQFTRLSHLGSESSPKLGSYISLSRITDSGLVRPVDKFASGSNYDAGSKVDSGYNGLPSRLLPHTSGALHPKDVGERASSFGQNDESSGGRADSARAYQDIRTLVREHGISSREFDREQHSFGEGARSSFNLPPDQVGSSSSGSRFPLFSSHIRRDELRGPENSLIGDHLAGELIGLDNLPRHLRGEFDGPHHLPSGESFSGPRLGEPGFRSRYTVDVFPSDGGSHSGDTSAFDQLRKRRLASIVWWCRICGVDCETEEGLDFHFQDRDHQKMAMDIVIQIKQQNAKKKKISDHSLGDANKSRTSYFEGRANML